jgi:hypothetical protein
MVEEWERHPDPQSREDNHQRVYNWATYLGKTNCYVMRGRVKMRKKKKKRKMKKGNLRETVCASVGFFCPVSVH